MPPMSYALALANGHRAPWNPTCQMASDRGAILSIIPFSGGNVEVMGVPDRRERRTAFEEGTRRLRATGWVAE